MSQSGFGGFDAAFEQLATTVSPSVVDSVGKMLEYPLDRVARDITRMRSSGDPPLCLCLPYWSPTRSEPSPSSSAGFGDEIPRRPLAHTDA